MFEVRAEARVQSEHPVDGVRQRGDPAIGDTGVGVEGVHQQGLLREALGGERTAGVGFQQRSLGLQQFPERVARQDVGAARLD